MPRIPDITVTVTIDFREGSPIDRVVGHSSGSLQEIASKTHEAAHNAIDHAIATALRQIPQQSA